MKEATVTGGKLQVSKIIKFLVDNPGLRLVVGCLMRFGLGIVLAGARLGATTLPFAIGLIAVGQSPLQSLSALLGSSLGYLYLASFSQAMMAIATGVLVFATVCVLGGNSRWTWFMPCASGALWAMVGVIFLVSRSVAVQDVAVYLLQIAVAGGSAYVFATAYHRRTTWAVLTSLGSLVIGCCGYVLLGDIPLGQLVAYTLVAGGLGAPGALPLAVALALVLQAALGGNSGYLLLCSTAISPLASRTQRPLVLLAMVLFVTVGTLFLGELHLVLVASVASCLALALPTKWYWQLGSGQGILAVESKLSQLSQVCDHVGSTLLWEASAPQPSGAAEIFEKTSQDICESCVLWSKCWKQRSGSTYQALCQVARPMMERGALLEGDFPGDFLENCCNISEFIQSVNDQLDLSAQRRQSYHRMTEVRQVLGQQYGFLSKYFQDVTPTPPPSGQATYAPVLGVEMATGGKSQISGDKGAAFPTDNGKYYVLLCDGMGTGPGAAKEATLAINTITGLLQCGMDPEKTLEILNGIYILRSSGTFATVDLLEADLIDGTATLYKWGGAHSYLKGAETHRIGTATPPPGLGVGASHKAQTIGLSLSRGEILVLLTDGADHPKLGRQLETWKACGPEELAKAILESQETQDGDDKTVVAVQLRALIRH